MSATPGTMEISEPRLPADGPACEVLCADEVAAWFCVDRKTVYNAVVRGDIPHQRLGKRILFSRAALVSWLAREGGARRKEAQDERTTG